MKTVISQQSVKERGLAGTAHLSVNLDYFDYLLWNKVLICQPFLLCKKE